ncbi:phage tail assembly chaperone [Undibacterium sp. Ji50W]|uniref:phage tail assembly chaperone n=1 Tax=Undibacterium sp. Ji50W TaxID=3413041 RepID=UPI003BF062EB
MAAHTTVHRQKRTRTFYQELRACLIAHAEHHFGLAKSTKDGLTERDHLIALANITGITPPELLTPPLPPGCDILWRTFCVLHNSRGGGMGPAAISPANIVAWQQLYKVQLSPWELDTIERLDNIALAFLNESQKTG